MNLLRAIADRETHLVLTQRIFGPGGATLGRGSPRSARTDPERFFSHTPSSKQMRLK